MRSIAGAKWLEAPETRAVVAALDVGEASPAMRFVGGCVRNTLLGLEAGDVDIATVHPPGRVMELAAQAGLKAVPTGIEHGTVTVVSGGKPFEVTTLRVDVKTHGRHADVRFTEDWKGDAARRDFTMNAVYADAGGELFDPVAGVPDALAGRVRFIGDAKARIREDYLRILRFFRFHAWYGKGSLDDQGIAACTSEKEGLKKLSAERIQKELLRLLEAPEPASTLRAMAHAGILQLVLPEGADFDAMAALVSVEAEHLHVADAVRRLAVFVNADTATAQALAERLRLSSAAAERLARLRDLVERTPLDPAIDTKTFRALLYTEGTDAAADYIVLSWARRGASADVDAWRALLSSAAAYSRPKLPIGGDDVLKLGLSGADVGRVLRAVEAWWIEQDFRPRAKEVLEKAHALAQPRSPR